MFDILLAPGKPSSLVPNLLGNLGSIHDTNFKAIQMVETGTVDLQSAQKWTANLLSQGNWAAILAVTAALILSDGLAMACKREMSTKDSA